MITRIRGTKAKTVKLLKKSTVHKSLQDPNKDETQKCQVNTVEENIQKKIYMLNTKCENLDQSVIGN